MSDFYIKNEFYNSCIDKYFGSNIKYWDLCRKYLGKHHIFVEEDYCKMLGLPIAISDCTNEEIELKIKTIRADINKRLKVARVISFTLIAILVFLFINYPVYCVVVIICLMIFYNMSKTKMGGIPPSWW